MNSELCCVMHNYGVVLSLGAVASSITNSAPKMCGASSRNAWFRSLLNPYTNSSSRRGGSVGKWPTADGGSAHTRANNRRATAGPNSGMGGLRSPPAQARSSASRDRPDASAHASRMYSPVVPVAPLTSHGRRLLAGRLFALILMTLLPQSFAFTYQLTVEVNAGRTDCFYQAIPDAGAALEIDYQVIDGDGTDINFSVYSPDGALVIEDLGVGENLHKLTDAQAGDYAICLANTQSYSSRLVFFEVYSDTHDAGFSSKWSRGPIPTENPELDEANKKLTHVLERVQVHLERIGGTQALMRAHEAHDRSVQTANYDRVNTFSALQLLVMILVGSVQVVMIRKLFNPVSPRGMKMAT